MDAVAPLVVSRQRDRIATTRASLFTLGALVVAILTVLDLSELGWLSIGLRTAVSLIFAFQAWAGWSVARSVITVDALRVRRAGAPGYGWSVSRADIDQVLIRQLRGRPYLVLVSHNPADTAPMSRWFLGSELPKNALVGPIDPATVEPILAALGQAPPSRQ